MVNIYKLKFTNLQIQILYFLCLRAGKTFNINRLSLKLDVSQPAIFKALLFLEKEQFVIKEKDPISGRWSIQLNRDNKHIIGIKRSINLHMLYGSGLVFFLQEQFAGTTIILFGSFARGDDIFNSDIDIAIIGRKEKNLDLSQYESALEKKISLNNFSDFASIQKRLKESLCNGIVLSGGIEL